MPVVFRRRLVFAGLCVGFGAIALLWPGDVPWINDEPRFIQKAIESNATGRLATEALPGHLGVTYGPMAIWFYAALLRVVHDLIQLVVARVLIVTTVTAIALGWIASLSGRLRPELAALAFLSPYTWFYSRLLWDNTLLIPLSAITLAAYIAFTMTPRLWKLWLVALGCTSMAMTHLMSMPLILAIACHVVIFHRTWLVRRWGALLVLATTSLLIASPYLMRLVEDARGARAAISHGASQAVGPAHGYDWRGWAFPFLGGRVFSAYGLDYFFGDGWWTSDDAHRDALSGLIRVATVVSSLAIPFAWIGLALVVSRVCRASKPRDADFHLGLITIAALAFHWLLCGIGQISEHPHYYSGLWICYFYLIWTTLAALFDARTVGGVGRWVGPSVAGGYAISLAAVTGFLIISVHRNGGNRDIHYGATLANQIDVAKQLDLYAPDSPLQVDVRNYRLFPHALDELRDFYDLHGRPTEPRRSLRIRYLHDVGNDGWLTLEVN